MRRHAAAHDACMNEGWTRTPEPAHPAHARLRRPCSRRRRRRRRAAPPTAPSLGSPPPPGVAAPPHAEPAAQGIVESAQPSREIKPISQCEFSAPDRCAAGSAPQSSRGAAHAVQGAEGARQLAVVRLARPPLGPPVGVEPQPHAQRRLKRPARHLREGVAALRPPPARPGARDRRHGVVQLDAAGAHAHARRRREQPQRPTSAEYSAAAGGGRPRATAGRRRPPRRGARAAAAPR